MLRPPCHPLFHGQIHITTTFHKGLEDVDRHDHCQLAIEHPSNGTEDLVGGQNIIETISQKDALLRSVREKIAAETQTGT